MNKIYDLLLKLVKIDSITASPDGEKRAAEFIYDWLTKLDYFKNNPGDLKKLEVKGKNYFAPAALIRAKKATKRTVILTGHFDVVDVNDCGPIKQWAFEPEEYTKRIAELEISAAARHDLDTGRYLFGRGVADMKLGLAIEMSIVEEFSVNTELFDVNILYMPVPDEEGDSFGMRAVVDPLLQMQNEGLDFITCLNSEPSMSDAEAPELPEVSVYYGTIGKIMPFYMCVGKETHVGQYGQGISSALIASYLLLLTEGQDAESIDGHAMPPVACLYMRDLRRGYAVTLPERTALYFNCLTVERTPEDVILMMRSKAEAALQRALEHIDRTSAWPTRVITVEELISLAAAKSGESSDKLTKRLSDDLPTDLTDVRERNIKITENLLDISGEKGPLVVIGFLPPFYPPRTNGRSTVKELNAVSAAQKTIRYARDKYEIDIAEVEIFEGITDLSYTGFNGNPTELQPLADNMPLWKRGYEISLDSLSKIDIPVLNLGHIGKDCHKITERADIDFSIKAIPDLLKYLISSL